MVIKKKSVDARQVSLLLKLITSKFIQKDICYECIEIKSQNKDNNHLSTLGWLFNRIKPIT